MMRWMKVYGDQNRKKSSQDEESLGNQDSLTYKQYKAMRKNEVSQGKNIMKEKQDPRSSPEGL